MKVIETVSKVLESLGAPYALIGGRAVGARGHPRMTLDYDFLVADSRVLERETWKTLETDGAMVDPRKGDFDDPIAGVVHIAFAGGAEADVLLARWEWELEILERSESLDMGGCVVPVPVTSDLILLKLAAGGPIDLQDVVALLATDPETLTSEVEGKIARVQPDVTAVWSLIKRSTCE
ncbi:MAG TPA: hypothetical protein VNM92_08280 [Thermoanaerobaculia bacterium]|nr:hypothetical protein [Thermoanaerobaculia bacterium]